MEKLRSHKHYKLKNESHAGSIKTFVGMTAAPPFLFVSSTNRMQHCKTGICIEIFAARNTRRKVSDYSNILPKGMSDRFFRQ
jgi:hypothetical protein